jgi:hypothetical protein
LEGSFPNLDVYWTMVLSAISAVERHGDDRSNSIRLTEQFAGMLQSSFKSLGSPELTPDVQKKLIDGVHAEVGSRTIDELEAERDELLLRLLAVRAETIEPVRAAAE